MGAGAPGAARRLARSRPRAGPAAPRRAARRVVRALARRRLAAAPQGDLLLALVTHVVGGLDPQQEVGGRNGRTRCRAVFSFFMETQGHVLDAGPLVLG